MRQQNPLEVAVFAATDRTSAREILAGVFNYMKTGANWNLQILTGLTPFSPTTVRQLETAGCDGLIVALPLGEKVRKAVLNSSLPVVFAGIDNPDLADREKAPTATVLLDDMRIGAAGAQFFLSLGRFRSHAFVQADKHSRFSQKRAKGFCQAIRARGETAAVFDEDVSEESPRELHSLTNWLARLPKPAAVMAATDRRATAVLRAAAAARIPVPDQLAVLGVDNDTILAPHATPPLSSIQPDHLKLGFTAAARLDRMLTSGNRRRTAARTNVIRTYAIIERDSTAHIVPSASLVERARRFIADNALLGATASDVVRHLGCSRNLADLRYRELEGKTIRAALEDFRLDEVKRLLRTTDRPIGKIASACGYSSANRLAHVFQRRTGQSMRDYRARNAP